MNRCKRCGVNIADDTQVCPLCSSVLPRAEQEQTATYPDIRLKKRVIQRIWKITAYVLLLAEIFLIVINYYTYRQIPVRWSGITGGAILYLVVTLRDIVNRRSGHIQKIYLQTTAAIALIIGIDYVLGFSGWSLEIGLPCAVYCVDIIIILCMIINFSEWQNYLILQMFAVLLAGIDMVLYLTGTVHLAALVWIALGISVALWTGTLIIGDRKAANELKRKFHI